MHANGIYNYLAGDQVPDAYQVESKYLEISNFPSWRPKLKGRFVYIKNTTFLEKIRAIEVFNSYHCKVPEVITQDPKGVADHKTRIKRLVIQPNNKTREETPVFYLLHSETKEIIFEFKKPGIVYCDSHSKVKTIVNGRLVKV